MDESPSGTIIRDWSDAPIIDQEGNAWRITRQALVSVDGRVDYRTRGIMELGYHSRVLWAFYANKVWRRTRGPGDNWTPPEGMAASPFTDPDPRLADIAGAVQALAMEVVRSSFILSSAISKLQADVDEIPRETIPDPRIDQIIELLTRDQVAASVRLVVPTLRHLDTGEKLTMALNIISDAITVVPIEFDNVGGSSVPMPAGSTGTLSIDNTANFSVALSADGMSAEITPVQPPTIDATGTLSYSNSSIAVACTLALVISADPAAVSDHFNTLNVTTKPLNASGGGTPPAPPAAP